MLPYQLKKRRLIDRQPFKLGVDRYRGAIKSVFFAD
jgi:hypothetical protein